MQDLATIKLHPLDLSRFGKTPKGLPLFRIVWADSRVDRLDDHGSIETVPLYDGNANGHWVLEKWMSAKDFYQKPEAEFQAETSASGEATTEYHHDGDYVGPIGIFPGEVVPQLAYFWAGGMNYDQANHTPAERARALRDAYALSQKQAGEKKQALIQEITERTNA